MRYLKLFEAFESEKLTKTLGYVDVKSRDILLNRLKNICRDIDFPFSQLNDSYFQYLPYQKALNLQYVGEKKPCQASSKSQFRNHGIEGEICQNGKIKRLWGSRQRIVDCPNCEGTGIQPEKQEIKLIKFWFTKEGELTTITGVDNITKPQIKKRITFSKKISDYTFKSETISNTDSISFLENGDIVLAQLQNNSEPVICYVFKQRNFTYLIQDQHDGDTPNGLDWKNFGINSWNISHNDFITIRKLEPKKSTEVGEEEIDPFSFNRSLTFGYRGHVEFDRWGNSSNTEKLVSKAHFALVFNLELLKMTEYKTKSEIGQERDEIKSGSRLTINDDDIKKANIERYMKEIAKRSDIVSDISNLPKVIKRIIGGENVLFYTIYNSRFTGTLLNLAEYYVGALKEGADTDFYKEKLSHLITSRYKSISQNSLNISNNISFLKKHCENAEMEVEYKIITGLENLSKKLYQNISNMKFECVEDIDIVKAKLDSIRQILRTSRYHLDNCDYLIDSLTTSTNPENPLRYLTNHYYIRDYKKEILQGIEGANKVLDRY